jgi:two-component system CheB/CheR fusion protein
MSSPKPSQESSKVDTAPDSGPDGDSQHPQAFPIVGIGGSAGGLEAVAEILEHLPPKPGLAILLVLHLEPHHESHIAEILNQRDSIRVKEATEGMAVEVNNVYLIPPNKNMALSDGSLNLTPRSPVRGHHMPVDHLFRSLSQVLKARAIGVLLSGGGSDGTLGFQAIKAEGGITLAQDDKSAKHNSMPRSAVLEDVVDHVLPPAQIAQQLVRIAQHSYTRDGGESAPPDSSDTVEQILRLMRARIGVDFSNYKRATINRRILRRMALRGLERGEDYVRQLEAEPEELQNLYRDFLIRVTQFFRDPESFDVLREKVFPPILQNRPPTSPVRIWVAGCATGEEVYSLAMCLLEYLADTRKSVPIKILATDLSEAALEKARSGIYPDNIEIDVSAERLRRFFVRINSQYQIAKTVRDLCIFSRHNLTRDPPFSHLDILSCRNVLIYMESGLQKRVLRMMHYALRPGGFLILGQSETTGASAELFEPVDSRHRIFLKQTTSTLHPLEFPGPLLGEGPDETTAQPRSVGTFSALEVQREADRVLLSRYAPVGVVVDEAMNVLQFRGRTSPYLEPAPGIASLELFRMVREGLLGELRAAIVQARTAEVPVTRNGIRMLEGNAVRSIKLEIIPFKILPMGARFFLVLFEDMPPAGETAEAEQPPVASAQPSVAAERPPAAAAGLGDNELAHLRLELIAMKDYLQSVIEQQESTNEELKSANEEILSSNEELQSTNEELQTAKEESQSANEELVTVNEELRHRNEEMARINDDLINFIAGANIPMVVVGRDLRVRRFTPLAEKVFNLIATDVGRPISDIKPNLKVPDLMRHISNVIDRVMPYECEIQDSDGRWCALRIRPYVTTDNKIDGASIVLLDIDQFRREGGHAGETK